MVEHWSPKPGVGGSSPSWPAIKGRKMSMSISRVIDFIKSSKAELDKVIFPTKVQVKQAFIAVIIVVAVIAAYLALVDLLMSAIVSNFLKG